MQKLFPFFLVCLLAACSQHQDSKQVGSVERIDSGFDQVIDADSRIEVIAEGLDWSEGPLWLDNEKMLLFSDVPTDTVFKWTEEKGKEVYLTPSGYTGANERGGEMGSNGLALDIQGNLILCQHGNRQVARMNAPLNKPEPFYTTLASAYNNKRFNSPNDVVTNSSGELFFTDPPYGLEKNMKDPKKELPYQGVFKVKPSGEVVLLVDSITRPNGITFLPGEKTLLVANSDPEKPNWYAFDLIGDSVMNPRIFYSAAGHDKSLKGLPDGMKSDRNGNVFASGPGGIWIFDKSGKILGKIRLDEAASNCSLSPDEKTLYITNDMYVLRVKMRK